MGLAGAVVEISSDDEAIPVDGNLSNNVPLDLSSHPVPQDCNGDGEGFDDPTAINELLASMLGDKKSACDVAAADDDGDDDDCVVLDGDPNKAVVLVNKERPGGGGPEEELQIVAEKGELACRDFPHPRHLCVSMPFRTSSHANHCAMCHCYVCDSPAPCAFWGEGTKPTDHCHATDKDAKWKKLRQSVKRKNLPACNRKNIKNFFQPSSLQQYIGDHLSVPQPLPSNIVRPSPVGFHVSRNASQNQQLMYPLIGRIEVARNVRQPVNLQEASSPMANISRKTFRSDGAAPPVYSSTNANYLHHPVNNSVLVQPVSYAALQTAQSQPASSAVSQNSPTVARPFRGYSQNSFSAPVMISQGLRVQPTSYHQVAPGISQGLQVQPTSYLQVDPGNAVSSELQLSQCSSLPTQGTQCQQNPSGHIDEKRLNEIIANLASDLGVDYNVGPLGTPQPNQLHAQMRPDPDAN
uniref:RPM1 interacting protein 13 n=1 Tax=Leersia perrieri TaxID=77586 RepID=A0A0D9VPD6_9ORYZ